MNTDGLFDTTEKQLQAQVTDLARLFGWRLIYHTHDSRKSAHGFPDLVLCRDRLIFLELKSATGRLSQPQRTWLSAIRDAHTEAYVVRPAQLQQVADLLAARKPVGSPALWAATADELAEGHG